MGKAVPKDIKRKANDLFAAYPDKISTDFEENKAFLNSLGIPMSKTTRNLVAGFLARKKARSE
ncbi:MAG: 30S ribosomal protein S17e [Candidatus Diapherotrites archaeon]